MEDPRWHADEVGDLDVEGPLPVSLLVWEVAGVEGERLIVAVHPPQPRMPPCLQRNTTSSIVRQRTTSRKNLTRPIGPKKTPAYYVILLSNKLEKEIVLMAL